MDNLTEKQKSVLGFIAECVEERNMPPTLREIAKRFGYHSTGTPRQYLKTLAQKGFISYQKNIARGIELIRKSYGIPVLGHISAGCWKEAIENAEGFIDLDFIMKNREVFALKVKGDSMTGDGIFEGDFVIVRSQKTADEGSIVVALHDNDAVVKRFKKKNNTIMLESANPKYPPIISPSIEIIGRVISVLRKY